MLLCVGIALRVANLGNVQSRSPDELVYTLQAKYLSQGQRSAMRSLVAEYLRDPTVRGFPPPTRLGYSVPLAVMMRLSGRTDEQVGRSLSCAASIGSLFLLTLIGVRFFPSWATLFALLFFAVSPMELAISRRAWTDSSSEFLGLLVIYAAAEITRNSKQHIWYLLFVAAGSLGLAVKETGLIAYGFCALWVLWVLLMQRKEWTNGILLTVGGLLGLAVTAGSLAWAVGGLSVLTSIVTSVPSSNAVNQYAIQYQSGPGYLLLRSLFIMSPAAAVFLLVSFAPVCLSLRRRNAVEHFGHDAEWPVIRWLTVFTVAYLVWPMLLPGCLNLRYISVWFGIYYLMAGLGFWYILSLFKNKIRGTAWNVSVGLGTIGLCVAGANDYLRFEKLFVRTDLQDLSAAMLLDPGNPRNFIHVSFPASSAFAPAARKEATSEQELEEEARDGDALLRQGRIAEAYARYEAVLKMKPDVAPTLNNYAWALSTAPDPSLRDGPKALGLARRADQLAGGKNAVFIRTLAAAYAENGRFDDAVASAQRALRLALSQKDFELAKRLEKEIDRYQHDLPLHRVTRPNASE